MRLYSGEPVHSAFNIGHRICTPDLIDFIQKVVNERLIDFQPAWPKIIDHQFVPESEYKATVKTFTSRGETFRISLLQGNLGTQSSRIFYHYCDQTGNKPHEQRTVYFSNTLEQLKDEVLNSRNHSSDQIDFFIYTQSRFENRTVTHFLRDAFGDLHTEKSTTFFTIPREESNVTLYHRVLRMPSYFFVAYWFEGQVFASSELDEKANQVIIDLFHPLHDFKMSELADFQKKYEEEHLNYVNFLLHSPD